MENNRILFLLGPNLNLVGVREKGIYGSENADDIYGQVTEKAKELGFSCDVFQSNHEGRTGLAPVAMTNLSYQVKRDTISFIMPKKF